MFLGIRKRSRPELFSYFFFVGPVSKQLAKFSTRRYPMSEISKKFKKFEFFSKSNLWLVRCRDYAGQVKCWETTTLECFSKLPTARL